MRYSLLPLVLALGIPNVSWAEVEKQDKTFIGVRITDLELRSVHADKAANMPGVEFVLGSYITDYVKVEARLGGALKEDSPRRDFDARVTGYASWYMGPRYPITDDTSVYGLFGFSFIKGDVNRDDPYTYPDLPDDLYDSSFSVSYALGMDIGFAENWYANFELGRIHRDSITKIRTMHLGAGIKYEF